MPVRKPDLRITDTGLGLSLIMPIRNHARYNESDGMARMDWIPGSALVDGTGAPIRKVWLHKSSITCLLH
ncbi:hypothetical protein BTUL_0107g00210 [Botrytis tulipae]|uniref:Uncharacterized protein n=1 Tax=Botrytis tulipae TaxID=87230 RepID=A0A4Z1ERC5_9HELO|nr:hypothetical protein BTUL_0107g00210 [Botrytis tulipae]